MDLISLTEARTRRLTKYFTGRPCKHGHIAERNAANRACLECQRLIAARLYERKKTDAAFLAANRRRAKAWQEANPEKYDLRQRKWRAENFEKRKRDKAAWIAKNPERYKANREARNTMRKTRKRLNGGKCTPLDIAKLRQKQNGRCAGCNARKRKLEIDHIMPIAKGGTSNPDNLQLLCEHCNRTKHSKDPIVWAQENGRLL